MRDMDKHVITTQPELEKLCRSGAGCEWIALDTEFMRVRTYYARLCLVQIADEREIACIDPLAAGLDLAPLQALLSDGGVTKIIHAARQDLEVLLQALGVVPTPVFDTQVAAALLGHGDQIGYAALVEAIVGKALDKAHTRTDWCERPLSREQVEYALDDVRYLGELCLELRSRLAAARRLDWARAECALLTEPRLYEQDPQQAYLRMGQGHRLLPTQQHILKQLAIWRESVAQRRNLPRNWVARDKLLVNIALAMPVDAGGLGQLDEMPPQFLRRHGKEVLDLVTGVLRRQPAEPVWQRREKLTTIQRRTADQLMAALTAVAARQHIAAPMLGTRRDMEKLARGDTGVPQFHGWRRELLQDALSRVLRDTGPIDDAQPGRSVSSPG